MSDVEFIRQRDEYRAQRDALRSRVEFLLGMLDAREARLAEAERNEGTLLDMIRHQRDVLRECLPYLNESMAGRRPGRSADDIRAAVKALTTDSAPAVPCPICVMPEACKAGGKCHADQPSVIRPEPPCRHCGGPVFEDMCDACGVSQHPLSCAAWAGDACNCGRTPDNGEAVK